MRSSRSEASILHADLDSFYSSVEQRDDPSLRGRPVAVGGGIVLAASYEAKAYGVTSPMAEWRARRLCPNLVVVPARFDAYVEASRAVFEAFRNTTPLVEGLSIDEAFLDVGGLGRISGTPRQIAERLRVDVREQVGLPISVGVATTKFLAKVASAVSKPDGLIVVAAGDESAFLHPLPIRRLWGVGPKTDERLQARGIYTVADVAELELGHLIGIIGKGAAHHIHALAHNRDPRPIELGRRRRSIGSQHALGRGDRSAAQLDAYLLAIVDRVTRRMRAADRVGTTLIMRLRYDDFTQATRSRTLPHPTSSTEPIAQLALAMLHREAESIAERGLTLIGLSVSNLADTGSAPEQLILPFGRKPTDGLDDAVDRLRQRFGNTAITRGSLVGTSTGWETPKLPD
ncbi:MAG TPA: DNA polymerase IV [Ilumatobacter sp.]|nr:DNA polymerase IV [Ilumatobacter sp.]